MAKLFLQALPSQEELQEIVSTRYEGGDTWALYTNLLFMKVATELEDRFDNFLAPYNLSSGRFTLLAVLDDAPNGLMPSELSQKVGVTQATISGLLNALEKAELVRRETHAKDGRSFVIKLTEKGQSLIRELIPLWTPHVSEFWGAISPQLRGPVSETLQVLVKQSATLNKKN